MWFDQYYLILVVPALLLSMWASFKVQSNFNKFSKVPNSRGMTGYAAAELLLRARGVQDVRIEAVGGSLTDHYDPSNKVIRLSQPVHSQATISAVGVAAHEAGHAIQHALSYGPLGFRSFLVPVANIGSRFGPWLVIIGLMLTAYEGFSFAPLLINIGIFLFAGAVLFYMITLPVEFNASNRAIAILRESGNFDEQELKGVKKVLSAAAMTYVASALTAAMSLLRLILLARSRRR